MKIPERKKGATAINADPKDLEKVKNKKSVEDVIEEFRKQSQQQAIDLEENIISDYKSKITSHPDFPKTGITFYDVISPLADARLFTGILTFFANKLPQCDIIVAPEARGFILGAPLAAMNGAGFVPIRKEGKQPADAGLIHFDYGTEYSKDAMELNPTTIHYAEDLKYHMEEEKANSVNNGDGSIKVENVKHEPLTAIIIDDVLATGGTIEAIVSMLKSIDVKVITTATLVELESLGGRKFLESKGITNISMVKL